MLHEVYEGFVNVENHEGTETKFNYRVSFDSASKVCPWNNKHFYPLVLSDVQTFLELDIVRC